MASNSSDFDEAITQLERDPAHKALVRDLRRAYRSLQGAKRLVEDNLRLVEDDLKAERKEHADATQASLTNADIAAELDRSKKAAEQYLAQLERAKNTIKILTADLEKVHQEKQNAEDRVRPLQNELEANKKALARERERVSTLENELESLRRACSESRSLNDRPPSVHHEVEDVGVQQLDDREDVQRPVSHRTAPAANGYEGQYTRGRASELSAMHNSFALPGSPLKLSEEEMIRAMKWMKRIAPATDYILSEEDEEEDDTHDEERIRRGTSDHEDLARMGREPIEEYSSASRTRSSKQEDEKGDRPDVFPVEHIRNPLTSAASASASRPGPTKRQKIMSTHNRTEPSPPSSLARNVARQESASGSSVKNDLRPKKLNIKNLVTGRDTIWDGKCRVDLPSFKHGGNEYEMGDIVCINCDWLDEDGPRFETPKALPDANIAVMCDYTSGDIIGGRFTIRNGIVKHVMLMPISTKDSIKDLLAEYVGDHDLVDSPEAKRIRQSFLGEDVPESQRFLTADVSWISVEKLAGHPDPSDIGIDSHSKRLVTLDWVGPVVTLTGEERQIPGKKRSRTFWKMELREESGVGANELPNGWIIEDE